MFRFVGKRDTGLITSIEEDVLTGAPLADALRKCVILGSRAESEQLRRWASRELKGYPLDADVPFYRSVASTMQMDYVKGPTHATGHQVKRGHLTPDVPDDFLYELTLRQGVAELQAIVDDDGPVRFGSKAANTAGGIIQRQADEPFLQILNVYHSVDRSTIAGLLDQVRTSLAEFIAELTLTMLPEADVPTAEQTDRALNIAVSGQVGQLVVSQQGHAAKDTSIVAVSEVNQAPTLTDDQISRLTELLPQLRSLLDEVPTVPDQDRQVAKAQVNTIEEQIRSGRPVREVLHHAAIALEQTAYGVAGSSLFETLKAAIGG